MFFTANFSKKAMLAKRILKKFCEYALTGSATSNGREPESCMGRVFNSKLGHIATLCSKCMECMQPLVKLKTWPRVCPVS